MPSFQDSWNKTPKPGISEQLHGIVKKEEPLKPRIQQSVKKIDGSIARLDSMSQKLADKDTKLFKRIVQAAKNHDTKTGKILANELAELRKHKQVINNIRISLDHVQLRLSTVNEIGDAVVALGPAVSTMRSIGPALGKFLPQASSEFETMSNVLGNMMSDSFGGSFDVDSGSSEESELILREAAAVATTKIDDKFPSVPSQTQSSQRVDRF